jgi:sugar lactone lactonase YvrE
VLSTRILIMAGVTTLLVSATALPSHAEPTSPVRPVQVVLIAGIGEAGYSGDGGPARDARVDVSDIAVAPDGTVYLTDAIGQRVRRVTPDGMIDSVPLRGADGLPDTAAVAPDGTLYVGYGFDGIYRIDRAGNQEQILDDDPEHWRVMDLAVDRGGTVYVADDDQLARVTRDGARTVLAGDGTIPLAAAVGKPASRVAAIKPQHVVADGKGTVYFGVERDPTVYRIGRDGVLAKHAVLPGDASSGEVTGLAVDGAGQLYAGDILMIYRVGADGAVAQLPDINAVLPGTVLGIGGFAVDRRGDLYVVRDDQVLRLVRHGQPAETRPVESAATSRWAKDAPGTLHVLAGSTDRGGKPLPGRPRRYDAEHPPGPSNVAVGDEGTLYLADMTGNRVRVLDADGSVRAFAGTGKISVSGDDIGDGGPATEATVQAPSGVAVDGTGKVYVAEASGPRVRVIDRDGTISTLSSAESASDIAVDATGAVYAVTGASGEFTLVKLGADGSQTVIAGGGDDLSPPDNSRATEAQLQRPHALTVAADGTVYFLDGAEVMAVRPNGRLDTITGADPFPREGFGGDGGPARNALFNNPTDLAVGPDGAVYVADMYNGRVRRIDRGGVITTFAGTGKRADTGDGGPAKQAALTDPSGLAVDDAGALIVTSTHTGKVRRIDRNGVISTFADLRPSTESQRATDTSIDAEEFTAGPDGTVYLGGEAPHVVTPDGVITPLDLGPGWPIPGDALTLPTMGPDGSVYFFSSATAEIIRHRPDGITTGLAVRGLLRLPRGFEDASPRPPFQDRFMDQVKGLTIGPDGEIYLGVSRTVELREEKAYPDRVVRLDEDGTLTDVLVGKTGADEYTTPRVKGLATGPDGEIYAFIGAEVRVLDDGGSGDSTLVTEIGQDEPGYDGDVAVAADGTVMVSGPRGIQRVTDDRSVAPVVEVQGSEGLTKSPMLAFGPGGDLYFNDIDKHLVRVVVRPTESDTAAAWELDGVAEAESSAAVPLLVFGVTLAAIAVFVVVRLNRKAPTPAPDASTTEPDEVEKSTTEPDDAES